MLFGIFRSQEITVFATSLVQGFNQRVSAEAVERGGPKDRKKLLAAVAELHHRAAKHHRERRLGFFSKARLGNTMKWQLRELGYQTDFIDRLIRDMLLSLASSGRQQANTPPK